MSRLCKKNRERLPQYAEGSLAASERYQVERHLEVCRRCRTELRDVTIVIGALRSVEPDPVPAHLVSRVNRALGHVPPAGPIRHPVWARLAIPLALATGLAAIAFALRLKGPEPIPRASAPRQEIAQIEQAPPGPARPAAEPQPPGAERKQRTPASAWANQGRPRSSTPAAGPIAPLAGGPAGPATAGSPAQAPQVMGRDSTLAVREETSGGSAPGRAPQPVPTPPHARPTGAPRHPKGRAGVGLGWYPYRPRPERAGPIEVRPPACESADRGKLSGGLPPIVARASVTRQNGRPAIGLRMTAQEATGRMRISIGSGEKVRVIWQSPGAEPPLILLSGDHIGPGPAAVPIMVESETVRRAYTLFLPILSRLGQSAPSAPKAHYQGQPLRRVLSDFSALTGLVLLAEGPLETPVSLELPSGPPESALEALAAHVGLHVEHEEGVVRVLTPRSQ